MQNSFWNCFIIIIIISTTQDQKQPNYLTPNLESRSQEVFKTYTFASVHPVVYKIMLHLTWYKFKWPWVATECLQREDFQPHVYT